jgi:hypothetical protein
MKNYYFDKLIKFIVKERGEYNFPLTRDLDIENDLNIYGDDAVDFIHSFSMEFDVNISEFEISKYFSGEGDSFVKRILGLFKKEGEDLDSKDSLTIGKLEEAIIEKKLK